MSSGVEKVKNASLLPPRTRALLSSQSPLVCSRNYCWHFLRTRLTSDRQLYQPFIFLVIQSHYYLILPQVSSAIFWHSRSSFLYHIGELETKNLYNIVRFIVIRLARITWATWILTSLLIVLGKWTAQEMPCLSADAETSDECDTE